jgi:phosphoribosyl-AMP cyclohydrolase / phosphoribosyl-ATP pyrophosphohydrolase
MSETIIQSLRFDERGLIPAIMQDAATSEVVALCYLDSAALANTLQTGQTELGAGDEIGKRHRLVDVRVNSDGGSLTVLIERDEQAFPEKRAMSLMKGIEEALKPRTPEVSLVDVGSMEFGLGLNKLYGLILERKENRPEGSYTSYLFNSGLDKILKKIAEESGEVIIAAKNASQREIVSELADLFYHLLVLMADREVKLTDVNGELARRAAKGTQVARKSEED